MLERVFGGGSPLEVSMVSLKSTSPSSAILKTSMEPSRLARNNVSAFGENRACKAGLNCGGKSFTRLIDGLSDVCKRIERVNRLCSGLQTRKLTSKLNRNKRIEHSDEYTNRLLSVDIAVQTIGSSDLLRSSTIFSRPLSRVKCRLLSWSSSQSCTFSVGVPRRQISK